VMLVYRSLSLLAVFNEHVIHSATRVVRPDYGWDDTWASGAGGERSACKNGRLGWRSFCISTVARFSEVSTLPPFKQGIQPKTVITSSLYVARCMRSVLSRVKGLRREQGVSRVGSMSNNKVAK
jgi:hypothetical protein